MATAYLDPDRGLSDYTDFLPPRFVRHVNRIAAFRPFAKKPTPEVVHDVERDLFDFRHISRGTARRLWEMSRRDPALYGFHRRLGDALGVDWDALPDETVTERVLGYLYETEGRR